MIKILVDTLAGDRSPYANVEGALTALNKIDDLHVILVGDEAKIKELLKDQKYDESRLEIVNAPDEISPNDIPTEAIRHKTNSSLYVAMEMLHRQDDISALVSTGSTGAILAGAVLKIGRIRGVKRPAFCPILPTMSGGVVAICDSGANVDCDSTQLGQFALMSSLYLQKTYGTESPRVALLNIGTEEEKGDALRKETHQVLKSMKSINFVGNMESRDLLHGDYDVVVCDGFAGNVLLKSTEGACLELLKLLKATLTKNLKNKLAALMIKKDIMALKNMMDYNNYGGAVLLGTSKTIVKGHGSSKATAVFHCIEQAYNMEKNNLRESIAKEIEKATDNK